MSTENKEILEKAGVETIQTLSEWLKSGGEFVKEQAPDIANEIVLLGLIHYSLWFSAFFILCILGFLLFRSGLKKNQSLSDQECPADLLFGGLGVIICTVFMMINLYGLLSVYLAPKLYILQQVSQMIK